MLDGNMYALSQYERRMEEADRATEARGEFIDELLSEIDDISGEIEGSREVTKEYIKDKLDELYKRLEDKK